MVSVCDDVCDVVKLVAARKSALSQPQQNQCLGGGGPTQVWVMGGWCMLFASMFLLLFLFLLKISTELTCRVCRVCPPVAPTASTLIGFHLGIQDGRSWWGWHCVWRWPLFLMTVWCGLMLAVTLSSLGQTHSLAHTQIMQQLMRLSNYNGSVLCCVITDAKCAVLT